jgi:YVTN family beta-propeller protein
MKKFLVILIIVVLIGSSVCSLANKVAKASGSPNEDNSLGTSSWTVMAYLDGDNNLEPCAIAKFLSLSQIGSTSNVKLVAELDRTSGYDTSYGDWTDTKRYYITSGMTPTSSNAIQDLGEKDMGDPNTLSSFISWAAQNYPASHYLLIMFDHGSGVIQMPVKPQAPSEQPLGILFDDTNNDYLTTPELAQALNSGGIALGVLYLDACTMGMIEVGYQVAPYADVMVASEETGWSTSGTDSVYNTFISNLVSTPSQSSSTLGTNIVNAYVNYWSSSSYEITCSAVDLTKLRSTGIITSTSAFAQSLQTKYSSYITQIQTAQAQSEGFEGPYAGDSGYYIDLYDFADHVYNLVSDSGLRNAANQVKNDIISATIISRQHNHPNAHGISIFFPNTAYQYNSYKTTYKATAFATSTSWDEWLDAYYTTSAVDAFEPDNSFSQYSTMTVTTSLQSQSRSLEPAGDNDYIRFYATPGIYTFYTSSSIDTYGYLYYSNQSQLAYDDDSGGSLQFRISYQITSSGYYFLRVLGYSSSVEGSYTLYYQYTNLVAPTVSVSLGTIDQGQNSSLTSTAVTTGIPPYTNQWFEEAPGGNYVMVGSNSSSFIFVTLGSTTPGNWSFILRVTDSTGAQVNSPAVTIMVNSALAAPTVAATVTVGSNPFCVAITPNGAYAYVTNDGGTTVSVISTATNTVSANITVGSEPAGVAVTPNGARAYVANHGGNSVSVIDTATNVVTATVPVGIGPAGVAVTPNGAYVYVTNWGSGSVSVISTATNAVTATVPVGNYSYFVAVTPNGAYAYVTNSANNSVSVISTATNAVTATVPVGSMPVGVAVSPNGAYAYVTNSANNSVSVISTVTNAVTSTVPVGSYPYCVAFNPDGTYAYVTDGGDNSVSVISTVTNAVTSTITVGSMPLGVVVTPSGAYVYVANLGGSTVSVISTSGMTVLSSLGTMYQGQTSSLTSTAVTTGTSPYTYKWFVKAPGGSYALINGATSSSYSFVTSTSNATGSWSFILQVTDNTGAALNSTVASVTVNALTITVTQTANGVIAPGTTNVNYGNSPTFTVTPNSGYYIASITTDTGSIAVTSPSGQTVSFTNVQAPHTITATFALTSNPTPTPNSGGGGNSATTSTYTSTPSPTATPSPTPSSTLSPTTVTATTDTGATVELAISGNINSSQMSNIRISTTPSGSTVSFTLTGESGTTGFSNVTIPKSEIAYGTTPTLHVDGQPAPDQGYTQDANNYYVWYTTHFSTHQITIVFTSTSFSGLPPEATYGIVAAVAIVAIVVVIVLKQHRRNPLPPPPPT